MNSESEHISQEHLEAIEQYLQNDMTAAEREAFEKRMADDNEFRKALVYYSNLIEGVKTAALKTRLNNFHEEVEQSVPGTDTSLPNNQKKSRPLVRYLAAALVLLAAGATVWFAAFQESSQEQFFAAYFEPDPGLITPMSSTNEYEFYSGMIDYKRENYEEAIAKWQPLLKTKPQSDTLNYFLGVAHLAAGDVNEALPYLQTSAETAGNAFRDEAWYYLGLAYLKEGSRSEAMQVLEKSEDERAAKLLTELEAEK